MKKILFIIILLTSITYSHSQAYYSTIMNDAGKYFVKYDTTDIGSIIITYQPTTYFFQDIMDELNLVVAELEKVEKIIAIQNDKRNTLIERQNKLIKLRDSQ